MPELSMDYFDGELELRLTFSVNSPDQQAMLEAAVKFLKTLPIAQSSTPKDQEFTE